MVDSATAAAGAEKATGLPQLDLAQWPGQIVWLLIIFGFLYLMIAYVFLPRIGGTIDQREDTISGDIGDARRLRDAAQAEADAAQADINQARANAHKLAADAKAEAKAGAAARQAEEDAKLAATLAEAEARIAESRNAAMGHVREIAETTAGAIVEKLTGRAAEASELSAALGA